MSRIQTLLMTVACVVAGASCATSPYDGQTFSDGKIQFGGFVDEPGAQIRFYAKDRTNNAWNILDSTTSVTSPTFAAGTLCSNSPALYRYQKQVWPMWGIYWTPITGGGYSAQMKARKFGVGEQDLYFTTNPDGPNCISSHITPGCDFVNVAVNICGYTKQEATVKTTSTHPWL